jgi:hypothetical protein
VRGFAHRRPNTGTRAPQARDERAISGRWIKNVDIGEREHAPVCCCWEL